MPNNNVSILYNIASYINHDCAPNSLTRISRPLTHQGGRIKIITLQAITKGDEITISYLHEPGTTSARQLLLGPWNFVCHCDTCSSNKTITPKILQEREQAVTLPFLQLSDGHVVENLPTQEDQERYQRMNDFITRLEDEITNQFGTIIFAHIREMAATDHHWSSVAGAKLFDFVGLVAEELLQTFPNSISLEFLRRYCRKVKNANSRIVQHHYTDSQAARVYTDVVRHIYL